MPDFNERRIAYHSDGTMVFLHRSRDNGNDVLELSDQVKAGLNSERDAGVYFTSDYWSWTPSATAPDWLVFFFPVQVHLKGIYNGLWQWISAQKKNGSAWTSADRFNPAVFDLLPMGYPALFEYSTDSTNGYDGTWVSLGTLLPSSNSWSEEARTGEFLDFFEINNVFFSADPGGNAENKVPLMVERRPYYWPGVREVTRLSEQTFPEYGSEPMEFYPDNVTNLGIVYDPIAREGVHPVNARRVRAVRVSLTATGIPSTWLKQDNDGMMAFLGLFGDPEQDASEDRLELRNVDNDEAIDPTYFSWGDLAPADSSDKEFRVRNLSRRNVANEIRVTATDSLVAALPASRLLLFSVDDGQTWEENVMLGSLGPGAVSRVVRVRLIAEDSWRSGYRSTWISAESEDWQ